MSDLTPIAGGNRTLTLPGGSVNLPPWAGSAWSAVFRGEVMLGLGVVALLGLGGWGLRVWLSLPMPAWLLDLSLALSMTLSVLILMLVLFIERPLDFSGFPIVLLVSTMIRLALNMASVRLILGHGHEGTRAAGGVIESFGQF